MKELLLSEKAVGVCEIIIIVILIVILVRQIKRNREIRERQKIMNEKIRNTQLEEALKNQDAGSDWAGGPNPFEIQYVQKENIPVQMMPKFHIEIEARGENSVQRYLFDLEREVTIGWDEKNTLPIKDRTAARKNCVIYTRNQDVYVKNLSADKPVCIQRGKKKMVMQELAVKLHSRDILILGKTEFRISLYEN